MSFIYSQALVAAYSAANCSDTAASALSSASHMPRPCWWHDKTMEPCRHSRFGMTYAPLTDDRGAALLTWWQADFLARTYRSPETGPDWTAKGQGYGQKWQGSFGKYDPVTHSLKTAQLSLLEDSTGCCATLPRWGSMRDGVLYQQPIPAPLTSASDSGYWPTLTVCGNYNRPGASATSGMGLATAVKMWPTATAYKGWSPNHNRASTDDRLDYSVERLTFQPGQPTPPMRLNPEWVEWLMGWPIGHTALKPLATARLAEWRQQHFPCCMDEGTP